MCIVNGGGGGGGGVGGDAYFKYVLNSTIYYLCEKQIHETHIDLSENFFF